MHGKWVGQGGNVKRHIVEAALLKVDVVDYYRPATFKRKYVSISNGFTKFWIFMETKCY